MKKVEAVNTKFQSVFMTTLVIIIGNMNNQLGEQDQLCVREIS
jgi:hypothetical protein